MEDWGETDGAYDDRTKIWTVGVTPDPQEIKDKHDTNSR